MAGENEELRGRRCKLTIAIPVKTAGDYTSTTFDRVEVNGSDDPAEAGGLRVRFKVTRTTEKEPNTAEITITNLSSTTRSALQVKGVKVLLEAGYVATGLSRFFVGDARTIDHVRVGADWETRIKAGDGERGFRFARLSESYDRGVTAGQVLQKLANAIGLQVGNVPDQVPRLSLRFEQGYAVSGSAQRSIDRLVRSLGYSWSIQDGQLQVLARGQTVEQSIPDLGPDSGLIGSPEIGSPETKGKPSLLKLKALLLPVRPACKVRLRSARYTGDVTVKKCEHEGDTAGGPWYTTIEGTLGGQ